MSPFFRRRNLHEGTQQSICCDDPHFPLPFLATRHLVNTIPDLNLKRVNHENNRCQRESTTPPKSQDQRLIRLAVEAAGISPWEADVLVDVPKDGEYHTHPATLGLHSGRVLRSCRHGDESKVDLGNPLLDHLGIERAYERGEGFVVPMSTD